jgi:hypothetical protein
MKPFKIKLNFDNEEDLKNHNKFVKNCKGTDMSRVMVMTTKLKSIKKILVNLELKMRNIKEYNDVYKIRDTHIQSSKQRKILTMIETFEDLIENITNHLEDDELKISKETFLSLLNNEREMK